MNLETVDQNYDSYNFADRADQRDSQDEQAWPAYTSKTSSKRERKKKAKRHAVAEYSSTAEAEVVIERTEALPGHPEGGELEIGVENAALRPDRDVLVGLSSDGGSAWPSSHWFDDGQAARRDEEWHTEPLSPQNYFVSPRPVPAKPLPSPTSPPVRVAVPHGSANTSVNPDNYERSLPRASRTASRRESFPSQASPVQRFVEPAAPPHMPQPHFYGLPNLGLDLGLTKPQSGGNTAGSNGYCCCLDSFADSGDSASAYKAKDALLVGSEGALEVFRILSTKVEVVGRLEGLRGSVLGAKILPHVEVYDDLQPLRPLVAVVLHGVVDEENASAAPGSLLYQTTVEIYSVKMQQHIVTLFRGSPTAIRTTTRDGRVETPENLSVTARGKFVVVASGKSGEIFVFSDALNAARNEPEFRCIGKFWASLQVPLEKPSSRPSSANGSHQSTNDHHDRAASPLFSLSQRWLAIVPPSTSFHVSIQCSPLTSHTTPTPPGLASAVAPPQPPITCEVTGVDVGDAWSRLTRQAAQGVVKYSQKGIDLGWQGWKELTNPTPQSTQQHGRTSSKDRDIFPPTKAPPDDPLKASNEPAMVCIMDLEALLEAEATRSKYPPPPLASFSLLDGCNFLSFSTSGLRLLAVSRKGETSTIWDLTRSCHGRTRLRESHVEPASPNGPRVRQIHCIPRSSPSMVVECTWSRDDDAIAILTTHGTVHLHEIPIRASRKRQRRATGTSSAATKAEPTVSVSQGTSPPSSNNGLLGSFRSGWQQVSTQVSSLTAGASGSSFGIPTSFAGFRDATSSVGSAGGRVLAKGLSQGLNAARGGASDYWHADDNKIRHKALQDAGPGALKWIKRQSDLYLAVVCQGVVHLHPVQRTHRRKGDEMISGLKHDRYGQKHFQLPSIRTRASLEEGSGAAFAAADHEIHGFWSLRSLEPVAQVHAKTRVPLPSAQTIEVETNPPYCPFHIDSRVDIYAFDQDGDGSDDPFHVSGHGQRKATPWLFGTPLPLSTKMNTHDEADYLPHNLRLDEDLESEGDLLLEEQVRSFEGLGPEDDDGSGGAVGEGVVIRGARTVEG